MTPPTRTADLSETVALLPGPDTLPAMNLAVRVLSLTAALNGCLRLQKHIGYLRLHRWASAAEAAAAANACVPGALLVRSNQAEAEVMTGETDPNRAARALLDTGAGMVVITLGSHGAILRGEVDIDVPGVPADVLSTIGAGDVLTGVLVGKLALSGFSPAAVPAALGEAVAASAAACERWGALE